MRTKRRIAARGKAVLAAAVLLCSCQQTHSREFEPFKPVPAPIDAGEAIKDVQSADAAVSPPDSAADAQTIPSCLCFAQFPSTGRPPDFRELQRALRSDTEDERSGTAAMLGVSARSPNGGVRDESVRLLQKALKDSEESVRVAAVCALGAAAMAVPAEGERMVGPLLGVLGDASEKVVVCAAEQLVAIERGILLGPLREEPPNPRVRRRIEQALRERMFSDYDSEVARKIERMMHELWFEMHSR